MVDGSGTAAERFKATWTQSFPSNIVPPDAVAAQAGGIDSVSGHVEVEGKDGPVRLSMWLYAWSESQSFIYVASDPKASQASQHEATAKSFRRMSDAEVAALQVRRLKVVDLAQGDTIASLSARMAYADFREERFRLINGLFNGASLPKSGPVKVVVWAAQNAMATSPR
jgi:hypothetical protein